MNLSFEHDVSLARLNTFGVEARAAHFVRIETIDQIQALRSSPEWTNARRLVLGGGSNLLLTRDFDGLVVLLALKGRTLQLEDDSGWIVRVAAGENWDEFVRWTLASGWNGLENLALIPGTVGAAPIQNIGAYGVELKDRFHGLEGVDLESGRVVAMLPAQCEFGYRDSVFKRNLRDRFIITGVGFRLPKLWQPALDYGDIRAELAKRGVSRPTPTEIADVISTIRRAKLPDPAVIGNAGSFFKNPLVSAEQHETLRSRDPLVVSFAQPDGRFKLAAGWLVEQCGWKGRALAGSSGRAAVHDKQALVLINRGGASGEEILALARAIQQSVQKRFGVELEPEPVIV